MSAVDPLSDALSTIVNNELRNRRECIITPTSKQISQVLRTLQKNGYIGEFEFIEDGRFGKFKVQLLGRINKCGSVRPRFPAKVDELEKWEKRYLPSKDFGILIVSTSQGILSHKEAKNERLGGQLLAYVY